MGAQLVKFLLLLIAAAAIGACQCRQDEIVGRVDHFVITKSDVAQKNRITTIYFPEAKQDLGLLQLKQAFTNAAVLQNNNHPITRDVLEKEAARIDESTLRPEILQRIKNIFGEDREAYLRVFVLPTYADRTIYYDFFLKSPKIQSNAVAEAEEFLAQAKQSPAKFMEISAPSSAQRGAFAVSSANGLVWDRPANSPEAPLEPSGDSKDAEHPDAKKWRNDVISRLRPGEVYPQLLDMGETWLVIRYEGPQANADRTYHFNAVTFQKANFEEWFAREKAKVKVD